MREAALALPLRDRMKLASELWASVASDPEREAAWTVELRRRAAESNSDPSKRIPWPIVLAELQGLVQTKP